MLGCVIDILGQSSMRRSCGSFTSLAELQLFHSYFFLLQQVRDVPLLTSTLIFTWSFISWISMYLSIPVSLSSSLHNFFFFAALNFRNYILLYSHCTCRRGHVFILSSLVHALCHSSCIASACFPCHLAAFCMITC